MDIIKKIIKTEEISTVDEVGYERTLNEVENKGIKDLLLQFNKTYCLNLFRGIDQNFIEGILGKVEIEKGIQIFFQLGEKSAYFYKDMVKCYFNKLEELLVYIKSSSFESYLSIDLEIEEWLKRINEYTGNDIYKLKLIYLYYTLLFHIEEVDIPAHRSMLISTTKNYEIAKKYACENSEEGVGLILHIIKPLDKLYQSTNYNKNFIDELIEAKIPHLKNFNPFPKENEVNFMLGIYPQCIFAIENTKDNKLYINPHLIDCLQDERKRDYLLTEREIEIDQSDFHNWIEPTNYNSFATPDTLQIYYL